MKNLMMFLGAVLLVGAAACSSSSSNTGNTAATCPAVGSKACPNDPAYTQDEANTCAKCLSDVQAVDTCAANNGITVSTAPNCGSDGTSQATTLTAAQLQTLETNCGSQITAESNCENGTTGDGGT